jgi:hypothetical protein
MKTVYVSIGNSDDKLSQHDWAQFFSMTALAIRNYAAVVHGQWASEPASAWQNACWCFEIGSRRAELMLELTKLRRTFGQDSVTWSEVKEVEFI